MYRCWQVWTEGEARPRCGIHEEHMTSSGFLPSGNRRWQCAVRARERGHKAYWANAEKTRADARKTYQKNLERRRSQNRRSAYKNREKRREYVAWWYRQNAERILEDRKRSYEALSGVEYNRRLLQQRRWKALKRIAKRHEEVALDG